MKKNIASLVIIAALVAITVGSFWTNKSSTKQVEAVTQEEKGTDETVETVAAANEEAVYVAPDFLLQNLQNETVRLSDYAGKKVIINFWATWCTICKSEFPDMQKFYEQYKDQGVEILAINVTDQDQGKEAAVEVVEEFGLTFPILLDENGIAGMEYQILSLPTSFFVNEEGHIIEAISGPVDEQFMADVIARM